MIHQNKTDYKVFISHSSKDLWLAQQIEKGIKNCKAKTFLDAADVEAGDTFDEVILKHLKTSNELLVLFTPWSLQRPYIWMEIGAAWAKGLRITGITHSVTIDEIISKTEIPNVIKKSNIIDINSIDKYFAQLKKRVN
jgi:hypothetical protein